MDTTKKRRINLSDIASKAGISKMTVSRYLRNPHSVSEKLQEKLKLIISDISYIPNKAPSMLSNSKSYAIGVMFPSFTNQVFSEVLKGIESVTDQFGYNAMISHSGYSKEKEEARLKTLLSYNIDGLILSERGHTESTVKILHDLGIPVVEIMDSISPCLDMAVGIDNHLAAKNMVIKMIEKGKKNIVYLGARSDERSLIKGNGYLEAMENHNLIPHIITSKTLSSFTLGGQLLHQALKERPNLDGIFCSNDNLALGALFECQRLNIKVPEQLSIAGFHGHDVGQAVTPKLASVLTPRFEIGKISAELLIKKINGETITEKKINLPVRYLSGSSL